LYYNSSKLIGIGIGIVVIVVIVIVIAIVVVRIELTINTSYYKINNEHCCNKQIIYIMRGPGAGGGSGLHRLTGGNRAAKKYHKIGSDDNDNRSVNEKKTLTLHAFCKILYPFFLPQRGNDDMITNRRRTFVTYLAVILSKTANIISPLYIAKATNALVEKDYDAAVYSIIVYSGLKFIVVACKELQTILFIKIKQEAAIQLSEQTFAHVHSLSLNWHLTTKSGNVLRTIDRGTDASSQLVILIFLYLGPALLEAIIVIFIFFIHLNQLVLGTVITVSIFLYSILTVILTTWKKKNREITNKMDNEQHDKAADSILNFETVKYFCMEAFETQKYKESVVHYQKSLISTQVMGSALNVSQQLLISITLVLALIYAARLVVSNTLDLGEFIAVNVYINQIFNPLSYLGQLYNGIIQSVADVQSLSDLLDESSDVTDLPNAPSFPITDALAETLTLLNYSDSGREGKGLIELTAIDSSSSSSSSSNSNSSSSDQFQKGRGLDVSFDSVSFHYPSQPMGSGIKNISFTVRRGSTLGVCGHTGTITLTLILTLTLIYIIISINRILLQVQGKRLFRDYYFDFMILRAE